MYSVGCLTQMDNLIYHIASDVEVVNTETWEIEIRIAAEDMPAAAIRTGQCAAFKVGDGDGKGTFLDLGRLKRCYKEV